MTPFLIIMLAVYGCVALTAAIVAMRASGDRMADRLARRIGLALPDAPLRATIIARARRSARWTAWGAAIATLLAISGTVLASLIPAAQSQLSQPEAIDHIWLTFAAFVLGGSAGTVLGVLTERPAHRTAEVRFSHATRRQLGDYLDPFERIGVRVLTGAAVGVAIISIVWPDAHRWALSSLPFPALAAVALTALCVLELGGRMIVLGRARIATSPAELAWDDALRADDLRRLVTATLLPAMFAVLFGASPLIIGAAASGLSDTALGVAINVTGYLLVGAVIALAVIAVMRTPAQHYLRRLWPEIAARGAGTQATS